MKVHIKRQRGPKEEPYWQSFEYNGNKDVTIITVLNALNYTDDLYDINGELAPRIRYECSCNQGMCGGCAIIINSRPSLACTTFLKDIKGEELYLEPLSKFPVIADLMVDRSIIYENLNKVKAYIENRSEALKKDYPHRYSISKCLKCGLCLEVCPNYNYGGEFFGGVFANDIYLLYSSNASNKEELIKSYNEHFVSNCSKALSCQSICPMKIETLSSILKMNRAKK